MKVAKHGLISMAASFVFLASIVSLTGCPKIDVPDNQNDNTGQDIPTNDNGTNENTNLNSNTNGNTNTNVNDNSNDVDTTYNGQATVLRATIGANQTVLVDTGPLPPGGGFADATGATVEIPNVLVAEVGHASTFGGKGVTLTETGLARIDLVVGVHRIQADYLMSRAKAECSPLTNGSPTLHGELIASNLRIDDEVITLTAAPNQEISLRDGNGHVVGRVVLNEQVATSNGVSGNITVTGLRIEVANVASLALFSAQAGITCGTSKAGDDFITGGGFFDGANGHDYFAIAGGTIAGAFRGHLAFKDTGSGMRVIGNAITAYSFIDINSRRIEGTCEVDGIAGFTFSIDLTDNGEPGTADKFVMRLSSGYEAAGNLLGGNIQLHANGPE